MERATLTSLAPNTEKSPMPTQTLLAPKWMNRVQDGQMEEEGEQLIPPKKMSESREGA